MNPAVAAFLQEVWNELMKIYEKESIQIRELEQNSKLQVGIKDYMRVSWRKGKFSWANGHIHIDTFEPFSWSDSSYKLEPDSYIIELTEQLLIEEFFPALCARMNELFRTEELGPKFFDYRMEIVLEFEWEASKTVLRQQLLNESKLMRLQETLEQFIQEKVMSDPPILPKERDLFFFAYSLVNPDLFKQELEIIEPLIDRLTDKLTISPKLKDEWTSRWTMAINGWAKEGFLDQFFDRQGYYRNEWVLKEEGDRPAVDAEAMKLFLYAALQVGASEPETRQTYLELAVQLGSKQAQAYLKTGSGKFESVYRGKRVNASNNDCLQTIDIRILEEVEAAYSEALDYLILLLKQGFPKGYKLKLKSSQKHLLPLKQLAKSKLHQFFANALTYPALFPKIAEYADVAMEEYAWYSDVEPSEKSVMPGTYAVLGLGLKSEVYFPLLCRYMELVDTEHQSAQDGYAAAFVAVHGVQPAHMPVLISVLLGGIDEGTTVKNIKIEQPEQAEALVDALKDLHEYEREMVLSRIFHSKNKLSAAVKKAEPAALREPLEQLLRFL